MTTEPEPETGAAAKTREPRIELDGKDLVLALTSIGWMNVGIDQDSRYVLVKLP